MSTLMSEACPRCAHRLETISISIPRGAGGYRDLAGFEATGYRCPRCGVGLIPGPVVQELMKALAVGGGKSERHRRGTRLACPGCLGNLDEVLLSWSTTFVEIEQCPRCKAMLLEAGEFPKVFVIEHEAKG
ncbi:MAG: zf-TFIIB domain-containing protein [Sandaracinaceae bacterium]|jgi:phage FluMu protein Com|nr:zf-TFIIB domain-containing protein [Sandaracinaceae bacterium]